MRNAAGLTADTIEDMMLQVCDGMLVVHSKRIIACDLKPANVLLGDPFSTPGRAVDPTSRALELKVADFGAAHQFDDPTEYSLEFQAGEDGVLDTHGTEGYAAPEATFDASNPGRTLWVSQASDVWSYGCMAQHSFRTMHDRVYREITALHGCATAQCEPSACAVL